MTLTFGSALAASQAALRLMPVSEIRPGMKGYGLTVFKGTTPERFGVEVVDVLHKFRPDQDLVLIRTDHPQLDKALSVAGMSGSPIYLDEKLIGAYAYGWTFGKEPIAGVTPISNMLAEIDRPIDPQIWKTLGTLPAQSQQLSATFRGSEDSAAAGLRLDRRRFSSHPLAALSEHARSFGRVTPRETRYGQPLPAATPLQVAGLGDKSIELLGKAFEPFGMMPVQAGGGGGSAPGTQLDKRFVDGGSIGVQMVRGDIDVTAVGTVTHVAGKRLIAFGHPMMNAGQVALSTCTARVVHVLSSTMRSFKLAEPISPLGTLVHDRQAAIVIDQQMKADMVPLKVRVHGVPAAPRSQWSVQVASHRLLTPGLVLSTLVNAVEATASDRTDVSLLVKSRVEIAGHEKQAVEDVLITPAGAADGVSLGRLRLFALLAATYGNQFEHARVTNIEVDLHVRFERDLVTIVDAQLPSDTVDPGKSVQLAVTLRRFDHSEQVQVIDLPIPHSAAGDNLELVIQPGDEVDVEQPKPNSLDDILRGVRASYPGTSLVVSTKMPSQGVKLRGQLLRSLPGSALDTLQPVNEADRGGLFFNYERKEVPLGRAVTGSAKLKLNVRAEAIR